MESASILVMDEEKKTLDFLAAFLVFKGYQVVQAQDGPDALEKIEQNEPQMVIADIRMPKASGLEFVKQVKSLRPEIVVIAYSPFVSNETTADLLRAGAFFFLEKPFNIERLEVLVKQGLEHRALQIKTLRHTPKLNNREQLNNIIGDSDKMLALFEMVEKVAATDSTVLIQGESGTGKELVARAIHDLSNRSTKNFSAAWRRG